MRCLLCAVFVAGNCNCNLNVTMRSGDLWGVTQGGGIERWKVGAFRRTMCQTYISRKSVRKSQWKSNHYRTAGAGDFGLCVFGSEWRNIKGWFLLAEWHID